VSLTYRIGNVRNLGDWTVGLVGRNLLTFTKYSGYDPEVGCGPTGVPGQGACGAGGNTQFGGSATQGSGSGLVNQVDAFGFPTLRTFTLSLSTRF
jgi:hypothetical protein